MSASDNDLCACCGRVRNNLWHRAPSSDPGVHAFVESAPSPPTQNARAGEPLCLRCGQTNGGNGDHDWHHPFLDPRKPEVSEAYAAGRARGIDEGPLVEAHELLREFMLSRQCLCSATHGGLADENHYKGCRALSLLRRIADAIAKETP